MQNVSITSASRESAIHYLEAAGCNRADSCQSAADRMPPFCGAELPVRQRWDGKTMFLPNRLPCRGSVPACHTDDPAPHHSWRRYWASHHSDRCRQMSRMQSLHRSLPGYKSWACRIITPFTLPIFMARHRLIVRTSSVRQILECLFDFIVLQFDTSSERKKGRNFWFLKSPGLTDLILCCLPKLAAHVSPPDMAKASDYWFHKINNLTLLLGIKVVN